MTVLETSDSDSKEPIKFPASKEERRAERQRRRLEKERRADNDSDPAAVKKRIEKFEEMTAVEPALPVAPERETASRMISWTFASFILMVMIPSAITGLYYWLVASPQFQVETQFSVRGSSQSSMSTLGLSSILGGSSVQSGDSYIVASYIESPQLVRDIQKELGIDLRSFYARPNIDFLYRIDPNMPVEKFTEYWRDMTDVSFNSTTGNTTLYVYAFSAEDTKAITDAVLKVSEKLVNSLSESSRKQLTQVASNQVDRAEERLRKVRERIRKLRIEEKAFDPTQIAALESQLTSNIEGQLTNLKTRMSALLQSVEKDAPSARVLQRQIDALEQQLAEQKGKLGSNEKTDGNSKNAAPVDESNLAQVLNSFEELTVEQGFATQAYTTALAALETSLAEAQKQERYFAVFIDPTKPEIALYPLRLLDSFIAFLVFLAVWLVSQFLYRSFRDHAI